MEWKRPPTTPKADFHSKKVMLCMWWDWKGVLYYELLLENWMINSNKYCSQLDQLKTVWNQSTENASSSIRIMQDHIFLWWPHKNCSAWLGSSDSSTVFTRHCTFRCPSGLYKILLMENFQFPKAPRTVFFSKRYKIWGRWNY